MIIDVVLNKRIPVKFVFDTGAEHTVLCKKELSSLLNLDFQRTFSILGADFHSEMTAYLARKVRMDFVNNVAATEQDILVLEEDYLHLDAATGIPIGGILGADVFHHLTVQIDYVKQKIKFTLPEKFIPPSNFTPFPIAVIRGKPYFYPELFLYPQSGLKVKLLLDTGAAIPLLLFTNSHPSLTPPTDYVKGNLAIGLGGNLEGYIGKAAQLNINDAWQFKALLVYFQDVQGLIDSTAKQQRNGIVGAKILQKFHLIIDYTNATIYLKPNKYFKQPLREDKSGLSIVAQGEYFDTFYINDVMVGSPAHWAGLQRGDQIISLNHRKMTWYSLERLTRKLQGKAGQKIQITVKRNGFYFKKNFILKHLFISNS